MAVCSPARSPAENVNTNRTANRNRDETTGVDEIRHENIEQGITTMVAHRKTQNIDPHDGYSLRDYRRAVLKFIKLLIRARAKCEPDFLTPEEFSRWGLRDIANDAFSIDKLLAMADAAHEHLWRVYIGPNGSGGVGMDDPRAQLKALVIEFAFQIFSDEILELIRAGKAVPWARVARWDTLRAIRDGLDKLPDSDQWPPPPEAAITIGDEKTFEVYVEGRPKTLTAKRFRVIRALVDVYPGTLTITQVKRKSGVTDAINVMKRMRRDDPDSRLRLRSPDQPAAATEYTLPKSADSGPTPTFSHTIHTSFESTGILRLSRLRG